MRPAILTAVLAAPLLAQIPEATDLFESKIRPVLADKCYKCHGPAAKTPMGGLRLDTREATHLGGASGLAAVTPGKPERSEILKALKQTGTLKMPPGERLPDDVIADFESWIKAGAPDPRDGKATPPPPAYDFEAARKHWSYQPVQDPASPAVSDPEWRKTAVDRFIKAEMDERKLKPVALANRRALIRRATYDLTGLPPTPDDVEAFIKDTTPSAFEKVIDRLLASPQYGERWGRRWLDVVRYADTAGDNSDFPVPDAYRYRNWVIGAFNRDEPYPQFLREQLAGDLLPSTDSEDHQSKIVATGYIAISRRFASNPNEHHLTIDDTIDNVGKSMLGLSVSCARCHNHKFDPIPQSDYYGLYGIFSSTVYPFAGLESIPRAYDNIALGRPEQQKAFNAWQDKLKTSYVTMRELKFGPGSKKPGAKEEYAKLKNAILVHEMNQPDIPHAYAVKDGTGANARIMAMGMPGRLGAEVPRGWLTVLGGQKLPAGTEGSGRLQLADWVTDPQNPLTARVMVNRMWAWHFGKGLVATPNDFGIRGEAPTHPELLDWLASRFAESGYSVKKVHKLLMLSRAYRLASDFDEADFKADPKNQYLWHFDRRRMEAEELRDSLLLLSGKLDPARGGAHPFPPMYQWNYTQHRQFYAVYETNKRSVYVMQPRLHRAPFLELFDPADPNASTGTRSASITALQALALTNSSFVYDQADQLAVRIGMAYTADAARVRFAYSLLFARPPSAMEIAKSQGYLAKAQLALKDSGLPQEQMPRAALASYLRVLLSSDEFFFID